MIALELLTMPRENALRMATCSCGADMIRCDECAGKRCSDGCPGGTCTCTYADEEAEDLLPDEEV
jgi:hypothetical protein